ncbi:GDP-Man:Man(3)GlcNAc(2)-PP-Dol alpha-1 [Diplonema papillatum]|nr:GDP-Man:Man(3)GlcNAc(2)-PP-Dol alpha-1 [Diplonema papillatum]
MSTDLLLTGMRYGAIFAGVAAIAIVAAFVVMRRVVSGRRRKPARNGARLGFFHPYSTGGGGGERVLWTMLSAIQKEYPQHDIVLYTHWQSKPDEPSKQYSADEIASLVRSKFGLTLSRPVDVVVLKNIAWVEASSYPRFTLILQSLGSLVLGLEALLVDPPDIWLDTMGYAFTYPLAKYVGGCRVACYTHYPTVSSDMLTAVQSRSISHNNAGAVASSRWLTMAKLAYYRLFAAVYGWAGRRADVVMGNSTWTCGHVCTVWSLPPTAVHKVYPPCDCAELRLLAAPKERKVVSVAQFRPEKNHRMQLLAFARLLSALPNGMAPSLHLVGGVRDAADQKRVDELKVLAKSLDIEAAVHFHVDLPYPELKRLLGSSMVGLHTMWNEHFGIGIVEYMASGCIPVAHRSGGPLLDIVDEGNSGYLAETEEEYAASMEKILLMPEKKRSAMADAARERSLRFTEEIFNEGVFMCLKPLLQR